MNESENVQNLIQQAKQALRQGERKEARRLASEIARLAPELEEPWLLLAAVSSPQASQEYLRRALAINPHSKRAQRGLSWAEDRMRAAGQIDLSAVEDHSSTNFWTNDPFVPAEPARQIQHSWDWPPPVPPQDAPTTRSQRSSVEDTLRSQMFQPETNVWSSPAPVFSREDAPTVETALRDAGPVYTQPSPPVSHRPSTPPKKNQKRKIGLFLLGAALFVLMALGTVALLYLGLPFFQSASASAQEVSAPKPVGVFPKPTLTASPTLTAVPLPSNTPLPTATQTPASTFTPLPSPTEIPTATEIPTITPIPSATQIPIVYPTFVTVQPTARRPRTSSGSSAAVKPPASSGSNEPAFHENRWVDVNLSNQTAAAYEGDTLVKSFVVSTGTSAHPTVTGQFRIYVKYRKANMRGPGYFLADVPYVMYFYQGYGLHGTYWHNNFGTPMSHGCVNLRTSDAGWLYGWAAVGTLVNVHY